MDNHQSNSAPNTGGNDANGPTDREQSNREVWWAHVGYKTYLAIMLRNREINQEQYELAMQEAEEYFAALFMMSEEDRRMQW